MLGCNVVAGTSTVEVVDTWNVADGRLNIVDSNQVSDVIFLLLSCTHSMYMYISIGFWHFKVCIDQKIVIFAMQREICGT